MKQYWIFKSEPNEYSISDLEKDGITCWSGIRNYQARNYLRDEVKKNDSVLFYHSSCKNIGIFGLAKVCKSFYPDPTQFDPKSDYFDPKSKLDSPRWGCVDIKFIKKLKVPLSKKSLEQYRELQYLPLLKKGQRLSILPIEKNEFDFILSLI
ncbi:MAG: EVE domain-containing protein [Bacteriovoracaceae bacterium]|jgi:predicted RNA-binding protein with PUA-like domain|nr:EVE domain-containing protein [Bacteriovoracaceae bacterium]